MYMYMFSDAFGYCFMLYLHLFECCYYCFCSVVIIVVVLVVMINNPPFNVHFFKSTVNNSLYCLQAVNSLHILSLPPPLPLSFQYHAVYS